LEADSRKNEAGKSEMKVAPSTCKCFARQRGVWVMLSRAVMASCVCKPKWKLCG